MVLLVSGGTAVVNTIEDAAVGRLYTPRDRCRFIADGKPWAADNGAFTGFDATAFLAMLDRLGRGGLFVAAPDVVGDSVATAVLFRRWEPIIHGLGFPVALVGQDGLRTCDVPWLSIEALFVGGTTAWKLGREARTIVAYARARGKWVHMGRVNSRRRIRYAEAIGCQSVDGSSFSAWSATHIPRAMDWIAQIDAQPRMF